MFRQLLLLVSLTSFCPSSLLFRGGDGVLKSGACGVSFFPMVEGPLTFCEQRRPKIGVALKGEAWVASYLRENGVGMVSLANNHIFDYEEAGVLETIHLCDENKISCAGIVNRAVDKSHPVKYLDIQGENSVIQLFCMCI